MRAIVSVSDKRGITDFVAGLVRLGVEVYSTGGTRRILQNADFPVKSISELTGFPEIMAGRDMTLHPAVHAGILARRDSPEHKAQLAELGFGLIDIVVVNLDPFVQTVSRSEVTLQEALEDIDIGGPAMVRAAAKNFPSVIVVVDPADYQVVLSELEQGSVSLELRRRLAAKAFQHTAAYDTYVSSYLRSDQELFPETLTLVLHKLEDLRYGENPHQQAAFYADGLLVNRSSAIAGSRQLCGKPLSFVNTLDLDVALACVRGFASVAVAIVKHGSPCGLACGEDLVDTYQRAMAGDPTSALGGAIAFNRVVDVATAREITETFFEDIVAQGYTEGALAILRTRRDMRVFEVDMDPVQGERAIGIAGHLDFKRVSGGFLAQTRDELRQDEPSLRVVTEREPTLEELTNLMFAWRAVKHVKSNAVVLAKRLSLIGVGAGQMSRLDSVQIALNKAGSRSLGSVLASDAYFPKPDGIEAVALGGVTAIVQPGGSLRDEEIIRIANKHHLAMIFTDRRHFSH
ncbi:MAG: bifunctional phosphoribosylaminoimidazolecarboxamide formyltransferase/IMP cyclohydrolase [Chloroflexota bacterium]